MSRSSSGWGFIIFIVVISVVSIFLFVTMCRNDIAGNSAVPASMKATSSSISIPKYTEFELIEQKAATMSIDEIYNQASKVSYDELKRNPDKHKGEFVVIQFYVSQKMTDSAWRGYKYENGIRNSNEEFVVFDKRKSGGTNIIEKDVITVYGVYRGTVEVTRGLTGVTEKIPAIDIFGLTLNSTNVK